ncbi:hypothetical protein DPX16_3370 [Anabarilius grahami]|uniref:Uncharacterized protein n=1 Tax=Anabarilius grahami TaxID=495550 RepID=A0A3N0XLF7_ANAGA|nr:hypothetical protein DPX16_3370 [Anabarilius grahami]
MHNTSNPTPKFKPCDTNNIHLEQMKRVLQPFDVRFQTPHGTVFKHTQKGAPAQSCGARDVGEVRKLQRQQRYFNSAVAPLRNMSK